MSYTLQPTGFALCSICSNTCAHFLKMAAKIDKCTVHLNSEDTAVFNFYPHSTKSKCNNLTFSKRSPVSKLISLKKQICFFQELKHRKY